MRDINVLDNVQVQNLIELEHNLFALMKGSLSKADFGKKYRTLYEDLYETLVLQEEALKHRFHQKFLIARARERETDNFLCKDLWPNRQYSKAVDRLKKYAKGKVSLKDKDDWNRLRKIAKLEDRTEFEFRWAQRTILEFYLMKFGGLKRERGAKKAVEKHFNMGKNHWPQVRDADIDDEDLWERLIRDITIFFYRSGELEELFRCEQLEGLFIQDLEEYEWVKDELPAQTLECFESHIGSLKSRPAKGKMLQQYQDWRYFHRKERYWGEVLQGLADMVTKIATLCQTVENIHCEGPLTLKHEISKDEPFLPDVFIEGTVKNIERNSYTSLRIIVELRPDLLGTLCDEFRNP